MGIPSLRPYQFLAIDTVADRMREGHRSVLLVSPTGSGKTIIAAEVVRRMVAHRKRTLFVAHARQLVYQASEKLTDIGVDHGVIMAGVRPRASMVQVASLHTVSHRELPPADLLILDEADLARANSYAPLLRRYSDAFVLGPTATPWRADGKGLKDTFSESVLVATPRELIDQGYLVPYDPFLFEALDVSGVGTDRDGEFDEKELGRRAVSAQGRGIVGNVVKEYRDRTPGRRGVVFAVTVEHSKMLIREFVAAGVPAEHIDGDVPQRERAAMFDRVRRGQTLVLGTVGVLTRGVDIPELEVCMLARPTKSLSLFLQMVGRCMRLSPATGKTRAIIHDHAGCMWRNGRRVHGLPDDPRDYSLTADLCAVDETAKGPPRCRACGALVRPGADRCPVCGAARPCVRVEAPVAVPGRAITASEARGIEADRDPVAEVVFLSREIVKAAKAGEKLELPIARFRVRFGFWPTAGQIAAARRAAERAV